MKALGVLEKEIVSILWRLGTVTVKDIHSAILADPNRELTAPSILNVLRRLEKKGWVKGEKKERIWYWSAVISEEEAKIMTAYNHLQQLLTVGEETIIASFAGYLDHVSMNKLAELTQKLQELRSKEKE